MKRLALLLILIAFMMNSFAQSSGGEIRRGQKPRSSAEHKQNSGIRRNSTSTRRGNTTTKTKYLRVDGYETDIYYNVSENAMTYTYDVECSSNYNVELLPYWCKLVSKDSNSFVINHDANPSSSERTGWFRVVASNGKSIDIHLNQAGGVEFNSRGYGYMGTSREYTDVASPLSSLRNSIKKWGECKTGSLTEKGVGIVIYGTNGYSFQELPTNISSNIKEIHKDGKVIKDVALSGASWWIVVYGKNSWRGVVPDKMQSRLEEYIREGDEIKSVSINENGDFTIVTDKHFAASNDSDMEFIRKAHDKFGFVHSACTTPMGIIVCCEMGIYYGNIPKNIVERIKKLTFNPKIVKYTDSGTCLFTDGEKKNDYYM